MLLCDACHVRFKREMTVVLALGFEPYINDA